MPQGRNLKYKIINVRRADVFYSISKHEILKKQIPPVTALRRNCWARCDSSCSFSEKGRCPLLPFHSGQSLRYPCMLCEHGFSTYQPVISPIPGDACTKASLQPPCIHTRGGGVQTLYTTPCCVDNQVCVGSDLVTWLCELPGFQACTSHAYYVDLGRMPLQSAPHRLGMPGSFWAGACELFRHVGTRSHPVLLPGTRQSAYPERVLNNNDNYNTVH